MEVKLTVLECLRCGHKWIPRQPTRTICPKCKSKVWFKPKDKKKNTLDRQLDKPEKLISTGDIIEQVKQITAEYNSARPEWMRDEYWDMLGKEAQQLYTRSEELNRRLLGVYTHLINRECWREALYAQQLFFFRPCLPKWDYDEDTGKFYFVGGTADSYIRKIQLWIKEANRILSETK